jgi:hypothetical protein
MALHFSKLFHGNNGAARQNSESSGIARDLLPPTASLVLQRSQMELAPDTIGLTPTLLSFNTFADPVEFQ